MGAPSLVFPPLQNLKNSPTPTAVYGARDNFRMTLSLDAVQTNTLPLGVQSLLKLAQPAPRLEDLVLMVELSGVASNTDRIELATFCGTKLQEYLKSKAPGLQAKALHQPVKQFDTVSSCTPAASQTFFFWHTANAQQRDNMVAVLSEVGGLVGLADGAFGPVDAAVEIPNDGLVYRYTRVLNRYVPGGGAPEIVVAGVRFRKSVPYYFNLNDDRMDTTSVAKKKRM